MKVLLKTLVDYAVWLHAIGVVVIFLCLRSAFLARRERERSLYTLEKEAATDKEYRVLTIGLITGICMGVLFVFSQAVAPQISFVDSEAIEATPAALVLPTVTPTRPRATATPTPTPTRIRPTPLPTVVVAAATVIEPTSTPTVVPTPPPAFCPNPQARLTSPLPGATVSGAVQILGSANIANFDYFKIEYSTPAKPGEWALITDLRRAPVSSGMLDVWDSTRFPNGTYLLRLVVVDKTGNYPEPCEIHVSVNN